MAAERCVVTEDNVLHDRLPRPDGLEEIPKMRPQIVVIVPPIGLGLRCGFLTRFGIMLVVPLLEINVPQTARKSVAVIAGSKINPWLRRIAETELGEFEDALRAHEPRDFRGFCPKRQTHIHRNVCIFKEDRMDVGRVTSILPAVNAAKSRRSLGRFINP